jgi:hypothetical protein
VARRATSVVVDFRVICLSDDAEGRRLMMSPAKLIRWSGVVSMAAGVWTVAVLLFGLGDAAGQWVYALSSILMIFTLFAVYAVQVTASGLWGLTGFVFAVASEVLMMVEGDPQALLGMLAGAAYALGLIALAIGTWRARVFSRVVPGLWIAAIVIGLPGYVVKSASRILLTAATIAFGLGFFFAGYELWTRHTLGEWSVARAAGSMPATRK